MATRPAPRAYADAPRAYVGPPVGPPAFRPMFEWQRLWRAELEGERAGRAGRARQGRAGQGREESPGKGHWKSGPLVHFGGTTGPVGCCTRLCDPCYQVG
jgi:hypothetical protein